MTVPMPLRSLAPLALAALLAACASGPRVQFHTLLAPADAVPRPAGPAPFAFRIDPPVRVPAQVDQPQLVLRGPQGRVLVQEYERWVAPVADEWRDALAQRIARRTGAVDGSRVPAPPGLPRFALRLELQRFEATPGERVRQQAAWSVTRPESTGAVMSCVTEVSLPAPADVAGMVAAQREAAAQVADAIAQALGALHAGRPAACPSPAVAVTDR